MKTKLSGFAPLEFGVLSIKFHLLRAPSLVYLCLFAWESAKAEEHGHHVPTFGDTLPYWVNLIIYCVILYALLKKHVVAMWIDRAGSIRESVEKSQSDLRAAQSELSAVQQSVSTLESEKKSIRERIAEDASRERARIISDSEARALRVIEDAKEQVKAESRAAERTLRNMIAERAIDLARSELGKHGGSIDSSYRNALVSQLGALSIERSGA